MIEARGVRIGDKTGTSDPYCVLKFGEEVQETNVIKKSLNPKWREQFKLYDTLSLSLTCSVVDAEHPPFLTVQLFDKDNSKADDFLGEVKISINSLRRHTGGKIL